MRGLDAGKDLHIGLKKGCRNSPMIGVRMLALEIQLLRLQRKALYRAASRQCRVRGSYPLAFIFPGEDVLRELSMKNKGKTPYEYLDELRPVNGGNA